MGFGMRCRYEIEIRIIDFKTSDGVDGVAFVYDRYVVDAIGMRRRLLSPFPAAAIPSQRRAMLDAKSDMVQNIVKDDPMVGLFNSGNVITGINSSHPAVKTFISSIERLKNISVRMVK